MAGHGVDELARVAALLEQLQRHPGVAGLEIGVLLVVEVVEDAGGRPQLLVLAVAAGVGAHRRLHAQHVLAQRVALGPLAEQLPGLVARRCRHGRAGYRRAETNPGTDGLRYPCAARNGPELGGIAHGEIHHRRRPAAVRDDQPGRQQERRPARPRGHPPHRGGGRAAQHPADPRRGGDARPPARPRRHGRVARRQRGGGHAPAEIHDARSTRRSRSASAPRSCWPARCSPASGTPIMPPPGGDVIGRRRLDPHLDAFRALGATVEADRSYRLSAPAGSARRATSSWTSRR